MSHTILAVCTGCTACVKVCPVEAITGERKNLHGIDPAICIDCGACGRICPADAVVDAHQKPVAMLKRSQWLKPLVSEKKCLEVCPTSVLDFAELKPDQVRAIAYLRDAKNCIGCSFCEVACPVEAIEMQSPTEK
jgi:electron transport complex protein RnfB